MQLVNIFNEFGTVYKFIRNNKGHLFIEQEKFKPTYYKKDDVGLYRGYDGSFLTPIHYTKDVDNVYGKDINIVKQYMTDKVKNLEKCPIKYFFMDIEVKAPEKPDVQKAIYPVTYVSIYNSFEDSIFQWAIDLYEGTLEEKEQKLLTDVISYIKLEKPDILSGHNFIYFDYTYLYNRVENFSKKISPVGKERYGKNGTKYPIGISIVDYLILYKKVYKETSYALDYLRQKYLNKESKGEFNFDAISSEIRNKNFEDICDMVEIEKKKKVLAHYDEIRRFSKVCWEDLEYNSRIIERLLLEEGRNNRIILPDKNNNYNRRKYDGAYRDVFELGYFKNVSKLDLASAYPNIIISFCLDLYNLKNRKENNTIEVPVTSRTSGTLIGTYFYKQNSKALLPSAVKKLLFKKEELKKLKINTSTEDLNYKDICQRYDALKAIVNSAYGVMGNKDFRLYDKKVAETITFLVRDVLLYCKERLSQEKGVNILYVDTDSIFYEGNENYSKELTQYIKDWALERYRIENIDIDFDYEGYFEKLLIVSLCHYVGYIKKSSGIEKEIKGVEIKRSDSSKYMAEFQDTLIEKIFKEETKEQIENWIKQEKIRIKTLPLTEIAFPVKLSQAPEEYATEIVREGKKFTRKPYIIVRALENAQEINPKFKKRIGELYYWVYVESKDLDKNVLAFDRHNVEHIKNIDWQEMIRRNIDMKVNNIFEAMGWIEKQNKKCRNSLLDFLKEE